jgi:hypothetical protein
MSQSHVGNQGTRQFGEQPIRRIGCRPLLGQQISDCLQGLDDPVVPVLFTTWAADARAASN